MNKIDQYSLESLAEIFAVHAIKAKKINEDLIREFKENNPGEPLPDHFQDDFNLPLALSRICKEILELKNMDSIYDPS